MKRFRDHRFDNRYLLAIIVTIALLLFVFVSVTVYVGVSPTGSVG